MQTRALAVIFAFLACITAANAADAPSSTATAIFAGGCFWCEEAVFDTVPGVVSVTSGYTGGSKDNPTYQEVSAGGTGHAEAVQVVFDPAKIRYEQLLDLFWHNVDPLTSNAQFCDHGNQYRSAIFYSDDTQKRLAEASKQAIEKSGRFHENVKNPVRYSYYRFACGRDRRLEELWGPRKSS
jgi:peptide-methionine (S)-S-oxide reductase